MSNKMMTIKEYAENKGVSYEAVRQQVVRYKDELKDNVIVQNRTQYLTAAAVAFLDGKRAINPVIVMEDAKNEELEELRARVAALTDQLIANQQKLLDLQDARIKLVEQNQQQQLLITKNEQQAADYKKVQAALENANIKKAAAEQRAEQQEAELKKVVNMTSWEFRKYKKQMKGANL